MVPVIPPPTDQFPSLQSKMRVVLRVEVEAVKFLKEEPHRLDALLKRCNTMTDALSSLRRYEPDSTQTGFHSRFSEVSTVPLNPVKFTNSSKRQN